MKEARINLQYAMGKAVASSRQDAEALKQLGYGEVDEEVRLVLSPYEVLYLLEREKVTLLDRETGDEMTFSKVLEDCRARIPNFWVLYLIYRDLRERGYVVKEDGKAGIDFQVYERGRAGLKCVITGISEGKPTTTDKLIGMIKATQQAMQELVLAVVDRRNEIVYYSLKDFKP